MPFPKQDAGVGMARPFRKLTLDVDGVETAAPSSAVFERQRMANGEQRLLIAKPAEMPGLFGNLAAHLAEPLFILYVLHTPRREESAGRYQSPSLDAYQLGDFLATFEAYLAGDARHDLWVHSASDGRTLIWDRHDLIFAEGKPLEEIEVALEAMGLERGVVPRLGTGPHVHYYRPEFDKDAASVLAHLDWTWSELRPEDMQ